MSTPRLLRQLLPLLFMLCGLAIFTSALFRIHDVPVKDLKLPSRWLGRNRGTSSNGHVQPELRVNAEHVGGNDDADAKSPDEGLVKESGFMVEAVKKGWVTANLAEDDVSPAAVDAILKTDWIYDEDDEDDKNDTIPDRGDYRELFSLTTQDRKFFPVYYENGSIYDANILPHPSQHDTWIVLAQREYPDSGQVVCKSGFLNGILICGEERVTLPIKPPSVPGKCSGDFEVYKDDIKTTDARMFHGPDIPYVTYTAPSQYTCYSQRLQDGRRLLHAFAMEQFTGQQTFKRPVEIQKCGRYKGVEKNYFLFWDKNGTTYVHHDLYRRRMFARLDIDGSVGPNLAAEAMSKDQLCMAKYMPRLEDPQYETIEQATNALSLTLCKRTDPLCKPTDTNTYIAHIFHLTTTYDNHKVHEPYLILFASTSPFAVAAISQRPFWIHGRAVLSANSSSTQYFGKEDEIPEGHTERFSVVGMSWKTHGLKWHGFLDDVVVIGLGIESSRAAGIDVMAGDLVEDLAFC